MESLSQRSDSIYDFIRKKWVERTPEELIRQAVLRQMVEVLGYPASLITVEKEIAQLVQLSSVVPSSLPKRRVDIVVYAKKSCCSGLHPLLIVECKAVFLPKKLHASLQQLVGYNSFIKAPLIALANGTQVVTGCFHHESSNYKFQKGLPHFDALKQLLINI